MCSCIHNYSHDFIVIKFNNVAAVFVEPGATLLKFGREWLAPHMDSSTASHLFSGVQFDDSVPPNIQRPELNMTILTPTAWILTDQFSGVYVMFMSAM